MRTKEAIRLAGNSANLARLLGITPGAVSQWGEQIPSARLWQLKAMRPKWFTPKKPVKESA